MSQSVKVIYNNKEFEYQLIEGTMGDIAFDISNLRSDTGLITLDVGYKNTGATKSDITFLDGELGKLEHRGYTIEDLAGKASFVGVIYLLLYGELPNKNKLEEFQNKIKAKSGVNKSLEVIFNSFPQSTHPMALLASLTNALCAFESDEFKTNEEMDDVIITLLAQFPVIASWAFKKTKGLPVNYYDTNLDYVSNIYQLLFSEGNEVELDTDVIEALNKLLILHADHEQNCSTSTVRMVGSSHAGLFTSVAAGVSALWGPRHGGANQAVIEMLEKIKADGGDSQKWINKAKDKNDNFRLMGFGHRVYKNFDPRAKIIKNAVEIILNKLNIQDEVVDIAKKLEQAALEDEYFIKRKLYPNVDFYSGIIYKALGINNEMFTVMFALGRLPGWIAQWKEMRLEDQPIGRPRQVYTGYATRPYVALEDRK
ncbi:MAG: citrate synthase [Solirubrobacteraceae bacterium]